MMEKLLANDINSKYFILFLSGNMLRKVNNEKVTEEDINAANSLFSDIKGVYN